MSRSVRALDRDFIDRRSDRNFYISLFISCLLHLLLWWLVEYSHQFFHQPKLVKLNPSNLLVLKRGRSLDPSKHTQGALRPSRAAPKHSQNLNQDPNPKEWLSAKDTEPTHIKVLEWLAERAIIRLCAESKEKSLRKQPSKRLMILTPIAYRFCPQSKIQPRHPQPLVSAVMKMIKAWIAKPVKILTSFMGRNLGI